MRSPRAAIARELVGNNPASWWAKRGPIEVEESVDLGVGGVLWVDPGCAKEIKGDLRLRDELVPKAEREVGVSAAEGGDEVIFPCSDGSFGGISSMAAFGRELEIDAGFVGKMLFEGDARREGPRRFGRRT